MTWAKASPEALPDCQAICVFNIHWQKDGSQSAKDYKGVMTALVLSSGRWKLAARSEPT